MSHEIQNKTESPNSLVVSKAQSRLLGDWIKNEQEHQIALTYGEKRIKDFNREDMTKLVEVMARWRLLLGVTSESTDQELIVICQFVYDNFKHFTLPDINLAMNWVISGKIDLGYVSQKTISSYYVSRSLNAYESKKRDMVNEIMQNKERWLINQEIENPNPITPQQKAEVFKELIISLFKAHTDGTLFYDPDDSVYNWLKSLKMVNPNKEMIAEALKYGEQKYRDSNKGSSIKDVMERSFRGADKEAAVKKYAREYVTMQIFEDQGLGQLISKIKPEQFQNP